MLRRSYPLRGPALDSHVVGRCFFWSRDGIVLGRTEAPLVNSGDAVVHIAN